MATRQYLIPGGSCITEGESGLEYLIPGEGAVHETLGAATQTLVQDSALTSAVTFEDPTLAASNTLTQASALESAVTVNAPTFNTCLLNESYTGTNDDPPDPIKWEEVDANTWLDIQSNHLNFNGTDTSQDGAWVNAKWSFNADEDFDIQLDFNNFSAPAPTTSQYFQLGLEIHSLTSSVRSRIYRYKGATGGNGYRCSGTSTGATTVATYDHADGKLRITKVGATVKGYHRDAGNTQWEWDGNTNGFTFSEDTEWSGLNIKVVTPAFWFNPNGASETFSADVDNFRVNAGCADTVRSITQASALEAAVTFDDPTLAVSNTLTQDSALESAVTVPAQTVVPLSPPQTLTQDSALTVAGTVNAPAEFHFGLKPDYVAQPVAVNAPADLHTRIKVGVLAQDVVPQDAILDQQGGEQYLVPDAALEVAGTVNPVVLDWILPQTVEAPVAVYAPAKLNLRIKPDALSQTVTVNEPDFALQSVLVPDFIEQPVTANAPEEFHFGIKPDFVSQPVTVNAPTDFALRIKPDSVAMVSEVPHQYFGDVYPAALVKTVTQDSPTLRVYLQPDLLAADVTVPAQTVTGDPPEYFKTGFDEYTLSAQPSDWTEKWEGGTYGISTVRSGGIYGGQYVDKYIFGARKCGLEWDDIPDCTDVEILTRMRTRDDLDQHGVVGRASGTTSTNYAYWAALNVTSGNIQIRKFVNGADSLVSGTNVSLSSDTWYWMRFRINGSDLKLKVWSGDPGDEPGAWTIETTDSDVTTTGWTGIYGQEDTSVLESEYDWFSAATNGGTAEGPPECWVATALTKDVTLPSPHVQLMTIQPSAASSAVTLPVPRIARVLSPGAVESAVTVPAPALEVVISPQAAVSQVTVPAGQVWTDIIPASATSAVTFLAPRLRMQVEPDSVEAPVTLPAPRLECNLYPQTVSSSVTANAPGINQIIRPESQNVWTPIGEPQVTTAITLQPGSISQALEVQDPRLGVEVYPARLQIGSVISEPRLYTDLVPYGITIPTQVQRPSLFVSDQPQDIAPDPLNVWVSIGEPTVATEADIQAGLISQPVAVQNPELAYTVKPAQVEIAVTFSAPSLYTDIIPATVEAAVEQPAPHLAVAIKPAALERAATVPAQRLALYVEPQQLDAPVTQDAPGLSTTLRPNSIHVGTRQVAIAVISGIALVPECITAAVTQDAPGIACRVTPATIAADVSVPVQDLVFDLVLQPNLLEVVVELSRPALSKSLEIMYPDLLEAPVWQPHPTGALFHAFRSVHISGGWTQDRQVQAQYINLVNR